MAESSKILTVSYGTFSCTLEGFDDSFSTMKAIAEYFRDLAADDRYFGAEPPTPDAEMLTRIAEREIARKVEARTSDEGIVLRAAEALEAPKGAASAETVADAAVEAADEVPDTEAADTMEPAPAETVPAESVVAEKVAAGMEVPKTPAEVDTLEAATGVDVIADEKDQDADEDADGPVVSGAALATGAATAIAATVAAASGADAEEVPQDTDAPAPAPADSDAETADSQDEIAHDEITEAAAAERVEPEAAAASDTDGASDARPGSEVHAAPEEAELLAASDPALADQAEDKAEMTADAPTQEPVADPVEPVAHADPDSVAAKLQRIRAVVGQGASLTDGDGDETAPTGADAAEDLADAVTDGAEAVDDRAEVAKTVAAVEVAEADSADSASEDMADRDTLAAILGADEIDASTDNAADDSPDDAAEADLTGSDEMPAVKARVVRMSPKMSEAESILEDAADAEAGTDGFGGLAALDGADELEIALSGDDVHPDVLDLDADLLEELALVEEEQVDASDADIEETALDAALSDDAGTVAAVAEAMADEAADGGETAAEDAAEVEAVAEDGVESAADALSEEAGDAAAAALEGEDDAEERTNAPAEERNAFADFDPNADRAEDDGAEDDGSVAAASGRRARLSSEDADDEAALSRLMSQADEKMNEPEGKGRREAISHLKAAVAAKEAARQLGEDDADDTDSENAFRDDLNEAVRPRRAGPARPERPTVNRSRSERPRPAPLKLVASQRVDAPEDADAAPAAERPAAEGPVRPRRIGREAAASTAADKVGGFIDWAEARGAASLTDLVEAAAVHTTVEDGIEEFARPQIMRKVRAARAEAANREDELRAFGTLLRQGRFEKIRAGRFRVLGDSRFFDAPRAAQG